MREEQLRRWHTWKANQIPEGKRPADTKIRFAAFATMFDDSHEEKVGKREIRGRTKDFFCLICVVIFPLTARG